MEYARLDLGLAHERQRDLLVAAAAWRVARQVRAHKRIARRARRLETLQMRRRGQVAWLRTKPERVESVG